MRRAWGMALVEGGPAASPTLHAPGSDGVRVVIVRSSRRHHGQRRRTRDGDGPRPPPPAAGQPRCAQQRRRAGAAAARVAHKRSARGPTARNNTHEDAPSPSARAHGPSSPAAVLAGFVEEDVVGFAPFSCASYSPHARTTRRTMAWLQGGGILRKASSFLPSFFGDKMPWICAGGIAGTSLLPLRVRGCRKARDLGRPPRSSSWIEQASGNTSSASCTSARWGYGAFCISASPSPHTQVGWVHVFAVLIITGPLQLITLFIRKISSHP